MNATVWRLVLAIAITLCLTLSVAACTIGHAETLPATGLIVTYSASATVSSAPSYQTTLTASCGAGEQLLAGGYNATDVFESALFLEASYTASLHTWTVSAHSISHFDLQALVYCLRGGPSLGVRLMPGATCPAGMTPLSQGQRGSSASTLCAAHDVTVGATPGDFQVGAFAAHCASATAGSSISETRSFSYTCLFQRTE